MKASLIDKLACPIDKHDLAMEVYKIGPEDDILEGILTCPQCSRYYPIIYGIPIMSPDEFREQQLEKPLLEKWGHRLEGKYKITEGFKMLPEGTEE